MHIVMIGVQYILNKPLKFERSIVYDLHDVLGERHLPPSGIHASYSGLVVSAMLAPEIIVKGQLIMIL